MMEALQALRLKEVEIVPYLDDLLMFAISAAGLEENAATTISIMLSCRRWAG